MLLVDRCIELPSGRLLDELTGREERALAVNVLAQPGEERGEIAALDAGQDRCVVR